MKSNLFLFLTLLVAVSFTSCSKKESADTRTISNELLKDKIAEGWAGKRIVTYGALTEINETFVASIQK